MNNHLRFGLLLISINGAFAMELSELGEEGAQNSVTALCATIKDITHDADGVNAWKVLKPSLAELSDQAAKATVARALHRVASFHKRQAKPLLCCFGGEELFIPVVYTASTSLATGTVFWGVQNYGIGAQLAACLLGGAGILGVNYAGIVGFVAKRKRDMALWDMACDMASTAAELAPKEEV